MGDYSLGYVCPECGSIVTPTPRQADRGLVEKVAGGAGFFGQGRATTGAICIPCTKEKKRVDPTAAEVVCQAEDIPFVFRLLVVEMAAMGINLRLELRDQVEDAFGGAEDRGKKLITIPHESATFPEEFDDRLE